MSHSPSPSELAPFNSSAFASPIFSSTLPLNARTTSDSAVRTRKASKRSSGASRKSSRPRKTRSAAPSISSSSGSEDCFSMAEFTLDLAKLGGSFAGAEDGQETGVTLPKGKVSLIASEDDGPADFTLNLEKWMKGTQQWQKTGDKVDLEAMQPRVDDANGLGDESVFAPLGTSTPAAVRNRRASVEDEVEGEEEHARPATPPLTRQNTQTLQDRAAEEVFSQISALQAEVERLRLEAEEHRAEKIDLEQYRLQLERDYDDLRHDLGDAKASVTSGQEKASANAESLEKALREVKSQLVSEGKRADEGWQAAERTSQAVEELRKEKAEAEDKARVEEEKRRGNLSNVASLRAKFEPLAHELELVKAEAESAKQKADNKIATLEAKLQVALDEAASLRNQALDDQRVAASDVENLRSELQKSQNELQEYQKSSEAREQELTSTAEGLRRELQSNHESTANVTVLRMELENAQEQLSETRRRLETVEDENDRLAQSEERHNQALATQTASLEDAKRQLSEQEKETQEARSTIEKLDAELDRIKADRDTTTSDQETRHQTELAQLKTQHASELEKLEEAHTTTIQTLKATLLRAGEGMKNRETRIALLHRDELASLTQQLSALKPQPTPDPTPTITSLRAAMRALSTKLETSATALSHSEQALATARQEVLDTRLGNEAVNRELEKKFRAACERREEEWRRRVELLLGERERMGKALLWGWGREEVGVGAGEEGGEKEAGGEGQRRQGYRYRFVRR